MKIALPFNRIGGIEERIIRMDDLFEGMRYKDYSDVKERINKNYQCMKELEELIPYQENDFEKLRLIELICFFYSIYVTGKYASSELEEEIITIGNENIKFSPERQPKKNHILIVMTASAERGGHSVLVNNWMRWDTQNQYSVAFTGQDYDDIVGFIKESTSISGGEMYSLKGDYILKARRLLEISQDFEKVLLFTHMYDVVPVLAYGNKNWTMPVLFYNHADFRFSVGISVADKILNISPYDCEKTEKFRGVPQKKSIVVRFPNGGEIVKTKSEAESVENRNSKKQKKCLLAKKCGFSEKEKLIVSVGADFKYESILNYQFDQFVERLLKDLDYKAAFLIVGADKEKKKWKSMQERTKGKGRALGFLPREEMDELIKAADLYILSFPMPATGGMIAERAKVPYLALFITERGIDTYGDNAARTVDELLEKSLDVLSGNGMKYLGHMLESYETQEEWQKKWNKVLAEVKEHSIMKICPKRFIETQEYVNCQLMQDEAADIAANYLYSHEVNEMLLEELFYLDQKYGMNIFHRIEILKFTLKMTEKDWKLSNCAAYSKKHLELYLTAIKWIQFYQRGKTIEDYLLKKDCHTAAIYGMSYMGEAIYRELQGGSIEVLYGIDRRADQICSKLKVYHPSEAEEEVDFIINSTILKNQMISEGMEKLRNIPVVSIEEILDEANAK